MILVHEYVPSDGQPLAPCLACRGGSKHLIHDTRPAEEIIDEFAQRVAILHGIAWFGVRRISHPDLEAFIALEGGVFEVFL